MSQPKDTPENPTNFTLQFLRSSRRLTSGREQSGRRLAGDGCMEDQRSQQTGNAPLKRGPVGRDPIGGFLLTGPDMAHQAREAWIAFRYPQPRPPAQIRGGGGPYSILQTAAPPCLPWTKLEQAQRDRPQLWDTAETPGAAVPEFLLGPPGVGVAS